MSRKGYFEVRICPPGGVETGIIKGRQWESGRGRDIADVAFRQSGRGKTDAESDDGQRSPIHGETSPTLRNQSWAVGC